LFAEHDPSNREQAGLNVFDYIQLTYNARYRHGSVVCLLWRLKTCDFNWFSSV